MGLRALITSLLDRPKQPEEYTFRYAYQPNPFEDKHYFTVRAPTREEADKKAQVKMTELFNKRYTVMTEFWAIG